MHRLVPFDPVRIAELVEVWYDGWHEAHAAIVPPDLVRLRTRDSFRDRALQNAGGTRLAIGDDRLLGFVMVKGDELYQLYVAPEARGQGVAQSLIGEAERRIRAAGHSRAWLACSVGNDRAARFYRNAGWRNVGTRTVDLDTSAGSFPLTVWRFEKDLTAEG